MTSTTKALETLAINYFLRLQGQDWRGVAEMYDPEALKEFKVTMSPLAKEDNMDIEQALGEGTTEEAIEEMDEVDFFTKYLESTMALASEIGEVEFTNLDVIGSLPEGESVRHVVIRTNSKYAGMDVEKVETLSFSRMGSGWGMMLQGKIKDMTNFLKKQRDFMGDLDIS